MEPYDETAIDTPIDAIAESVVDAASTFVQIDGRVGRPGAVGLDALGSLAEPFSDGRLRVPLIDLLASVQLRSSAEIVVFTGSDDRRIGVPVAAIVRNPNATVRIDPVASVVWLEVDGWTDPSFPVAVRRIRAVSFAEFVVQS